MKTSEVLTNAKALIENPDNWIKEFYFQEKEGKKCYCSLGAISAVSGVEYNYASQSKAAIALLEIVKDQVDQKRETFAVFNDNSSHKQVMKAFDDAIALSISKGD